MAPISGHAITRACRYCATFSAIAFSREVSAVCIELVHVTVDLKLVHGWTTQFSCSGVGSNRVLRGPPIQIMDVALITEFCDHNNYSFVEVVF